MLEVRRGTYADESTGAALAVLEDVAGRLGRAVERAIGT